MKVKSGSTSAIHQAKAPAATERKRRMTDLTLTTYDWVPEPPRGYVRDLRVRWALEEAGLPYRVESTPFRDRAGRPSRLSRLCRTRHGPPGFQESIRRPDGAFCCCRSK